MYYISLKLCTQYSFNNYYIGAVYIYLRKKCYGSLMEVVPRIFGLMMHSTSSYYGTEHKFKLIKDIPSCINAVF